MVWSITWRESYVGGTGKSMTEWRLSHAREDNCCNIRITQAARQTFLDLPQRDVALWLAVFETLVYAPPVSR